MISRAEILRWLREFDDERLEPLWREADRARREAVGDEVHLRGLVEISNCCVRSCGYCGLRREHHELPRYRMTAEEVLACAREGERLGYGTLVLQSGEDPAITAQEMAGLVRRIKRETPLAVTLSLGERRDDELRLWREAGADRYLLRFETTNAALYARIHPALGRTSGDRIALLVRLREMGYEVGSGVMVGIPGQSWDDLANDIEMFARLDLDMIGVGPFIPHPATPLGNATAAQGSSLPSAEQVPRDARTTWKTIALARLACPRTNIPSTTALAAIDAEQGRALGLQRGANVVMPNLTPLTYRAHYDVYPGKPGTETAETFHAALVAQIQAMGRAIGAGQGPAPAMRARAREERS